jgi:HKD family nuclease
MNEGLYTNRSSRRDFVKNPFINYVTGGMNVYIAVAFFTEADLIKEILSKGCHVRLIIRLGFPTNPKVLNDLMSLKNMEIRYFTNTSFHSKLFIFGDSVALVGSANLTNAAIMTNQEVVVSIPSKDNRFVELASLFTDYWDDADVLTSEVLDTYKKIYNKRASISSDIKEFDNDVLTKIGDVVATNINRGLKKESQETIFLKSYKKTYQECITAFEVIKEVYEKYNQRKIYEEKIPLRLEIDSFISFVRETHTKKDSWFFEPLRSGNEQKEMIGNLIQEWFETPWPYFEKTIVEENYPKISLAFSSKESIRNLDDETLFDALFVIHSFHDRLRFYQDGLPTLKNEFFAQNDAEKIRETLAYLIFGSDGVINRLANVIFNSKYKLNLFGQANAQELIGWVSKENLPVINGRTTKVLRYFGFNVRQL